MANILSEEHDKILKEHATQIKSKIKEIPWLSIYTEDSRYILYASRIVSSIDETLLDRGLEFKKYRTDEAEFNIAENMLIIIYACLKQTLNACNNSVKYFNKEECKLVESSLFYQNDYFRIEVVLDSKALSIEHKTVELTAIIRIPLNEIDKLVKPLDAMSLSLIECTATSRSSDHSSLGSGLFSGLFEDNCSILDLEKVLSSHKKLFKI